MEFSKYCAYFHDGELIDIHHSGENIEIAMSSAEIDPEDIEDYLPIAADHTIKGKLHLEKVTSILISNKPFLGVVKKMYSDGEILDFEVQEAL